jgi:hypothetical protein
MANLAFTLLLTAASAEQVHTPVVKHVVNNVPWWPKENLKYEEAVGVVSRGHLFATGMMECPYTSDDDGAICANSHFNASRDFGLELVDLDAIIKAANASHVVDCVVNVPAGSAAAAMAGLEKAFGGAAHAPCLTVLETKGEDPQYNASISCSAAVPEKTPTQPQPRQPLGGREQAQHRVFRRVSGGQSSLSAPVTTTVAPSSHGMYWLTAEAPAHTPGTSPGSNPAATPMFWAEIDQALGAAANVRGEELTNSDIVDCTVFLPPALAQSEVVAVQSAAARATAGSGASSGATVVPAQITLAQVPLGSGSGRFAGAQAAVKLRCTALVGGAAGKRVYRPKPTSGVKNGASVVVAGGFAYVSGVGSGRPNATDALSEVGRALRAAGSRLDLVLNCLFWVASTPGGIGPVFSGFYDAFNCRLEGNKNTTGHAFKQCAVFQPAAGYPPPSRTEFVGAAVASQCLGGREGPTRCPALTKCVAAMPASASASAAAAAANYR